MKKILFTIIICAIIVPGLFLTSSCERKYENEAFVIEKKGEYPDKYFLLKKLPQDKWHDTLFTVISVDNFKYMDHTAWDQMYFSYAVHDTVYLTIKKEKFWRKITEKN